MKYIVVLGDGMADEPIKELKEKTPLEYANTPTMDCMAKRGEIGLVRTVPEGMKPGSDTANLSVIGYNPKKYYTGRSPLEALSIGVDMEETDVAIRCNLVTLSEEEEYSKKKMIDHSASEISTEDAKILFDAVVSEVENEVFRYYLGVSYRHCLIWKKGEVVELTPPHDILGKNVEDYLLVEFLLDIQKKSYEILKNHPLNRERKEKGLHPANSFWFWGAGTKPALDSFFLRYGKKGAMISAVDLLKGIAVGTGLSNIEVYGANGGLHTNYEGKANAAIKALLEDGFDFVYVHVEAPDEMGHQGSLENKIKAIEFLDERVISLIKEKMDRSGEDYRILVLPDHPTPVRLRTHTSNPVPYLLFDSRKDVLHSHLYNEREAKSSGNYIEEGFRLMEHLFE
ncbi:MAG TPA: cofactor-independent phosphoglycerate mutase [Lachnospiraceae bacterium]